MITVEQLAIAGRRRGCQATLGSPFCPWHCGATFRKAGPAPTASLGTPATRPDSRKTHLEGVWERRSLCTRASYGHQREDPTALRVQQAMG